MATTLYLIRHGETEENAQGILQGHLPGRLSERGKQQAREQAETLQHIPFDAVWSSDLQRCVDTTRLLNQDRNLPVHYTPLLRECDWGPFTGRNLLKERLQIDHRAESVEAMSQRAAQLLNQWYEEAEGRTLLVVSHGLFCRVLQGTATGSPIKEIPKMNNAEVRIVTLTAPVTPYLHDGAHEATDR